MKRAFNWVPIMPSDATADLTLFSSLALHTEKTFWNLVNSNLNHIVFTIFRLIWNQTDVHLDPNRSENGKYNLISV